MVESPEAILFEPITTVDPDAPLENTNKPDDNTNKALEPELLLMKQQPITSSFRQTIKHLQSKGGFRSRFRGFSIYIVMNMIINVVAQMFSSLIPFVGTFIAPIIASVACAQLSLAWTHIVISDPSPKPWFRRVPAINTWKKVAGPTAILAIAHQLAVIVPVYFAISLGFSSAERGFDNGFDGRHAINASMSLGLIILSLAFSVFVVMPAQVVLTRVQASLLPDEAESIVPFDRSFNGKVIPAIIGGSGVIGMSDAWKSFDWNSRVRLVKAYVKVFAMQFALALVFFVIAGAQIALIIGKDLNKVFPGDGKAGQPVVV